MKNFKVGDIVFDNLLCRNNEFHYYKITEICFISSRIEASRIAIRRSYNLDIYLRIEELGIGGNIKRYRFDRRLSLANHRELKIINKLLTFQ